MRIAWKFELEKDRVSGVASYLIRLLLPVIQRFDKSPAKKATVRLANSTETQKRVREFYDCDSQVIHPPVNTQSSSGDVTSVQNREYYLCLGRLVDYKRVDHAIIACNMTGRRLIVAGTGPAEAYLRGIAGPTVEFVGQVDESLKTQLLRGARALLFPGLEDFGIVPVEAMSHGTPVIALGKGGVLDSVTSAAGVLYNDSDANSLADAIGEFELESYDPISIMQHAATFNDIHFRQKLLDVVESVQANLSAEKLSTLNTR